MKRAREDQNPEQRAAKKRAPNNRKDAESKTLQAGTVNWRVFFNNQASMLLTRIPLKRDTWN
jgi:hypothetical protein